MLARLAVVLACSLAPLAARAEPAMWVVRDADSEMVLFGSLHVLPPGVEWRPAGLERALARADDVWFEMPMTPEADAQSAQLAARLGMLAPGRRLSDLLGPSLWRRLAAAAQRYRLSPEMLDRMEPWLAEIALAGAVFAAAGAAPANGADKQIEQAAPPSAARKAFETAAGQIALFDEAPIEQQIASLENSIAELEADPDVYGALLETWLSGDPQRLERKALAPLRAAAPGLFARLVTARNAAWTEALDARLKGSGRTVVVVGAGHLVGEDGLPTMLRALGYSVTGP